MYTVVFGAMLSLARWNGLSPEWTWVGVDNFVQLAFADPIIAPITREAALHTLVVMVALPTLVILVSLPMALLLSSITRLRTFLRTIYFLPYVTAGIAVFYAWRFMYDPDGIVNTTLRSVGFGTLAEPQGWLGSPDTALPALIVVFVWTSAPLGILLYLTGLLTMDGDVIDAARIDGATTPQMVRRIYWPLLLPITALLVIIMLREALQSFQLFLLMTRGGPAGSTNVLGLEVYDLAFGRLGFDLGVASALGWSLFAVGLILSLVNLRLLRSRT